MAVRKGTSRRCFVAAGVDLIAHRLLGTPEAQKACVLALRLAGEKTASLPALLHGRGVWLGHDRLARGASTCPRFTASGCRGSASPALEFRGKQDQDSFRGHSTPGKKV
jgi:hypothetical protein